MPKTLTDIKCDICGTESQTEYWSFIIVPEEKEAVDSLFAGEINIFTCPHCDSRKFIDYPLGYYDRQLGIFLQYFPEPYVADTSIYEYFDLNGNMSEETISDILQRHLASTDENKAYGAPDYLPNESRVFFDLRDLVHFAIFRTNIFSYYYDKSKFLRETKVPEPLMKRWRGFYKKEKIRLIYAICQHINCNEVYSEYQLIDLIRSNLNLCSRNVRLNQTCSADHIKVGLIEMQLMERNPEGTAYWRVPAPLLSSNLTFPQKISDMSKTGYLLYGNEGDGYSVNYSNGKGDRGNIYIYDKGLRTIDATDIENEFKRSEEEYFLLKDSLQIKELSKRSSQVYSIDKNGARLDFYISDFDVLEKDADRKNRSYFVLTSLNKKFLKVRLTYTADSNPDAKFSEFIGDFVASSFLRET